MVFHITYSIKPGQRNDSQGRFRATGAPPPAGVTMTSRWHSAEGLKGFIIAESADAAALARWTQSWTDLLTFEIVPVVNDEQLTKILS